MAKIDLAYDIVNYTPATATPVEANFDRVEQHINQEVVERDGTVAMRAQLKLVGDPVNDLDAAPKQYVDQVLPIGIVMMYGGAGTPPGGRWAVCNGAELQTAEYSELYNIILHNFSPAGTPTSRFNLPNLSSRMPIGSGTIAAIGKYGGSKDAVVISHTHGLANHTHTIAHAHPTATTDTEPVHNHGVPRRLGATGGGAGVASAAGTIDPDGSFTTNGGGSHAHNVAIPATTTVNSGGPTGDLTNTTGVAGTNLNMPPYLGVQFVIRVK